MKTEQTECSETSAYKIQTPGNYPEENIQLSIPVSKFYYVSSFSTVRHYFQRSQNECKKGTVLCTYTALQLLLKLNTRINIHVKTFVAANIFQYTWRQGPEISSRARFWVSPTSQRKHSPWCLRLSGINKTTMKLQNAFLM